MAALTAEKESGGGFTALQIGIDNNLPVIAQVHRLQLVELLPPLLNMGNVNLVAVK